MSCQEQNTESGIFEFDARGISRRFRHAAVCGALESLNNGDILRFSNDHDPLPLLQLLQMRYREQIAIEYVSRKEDEVVIDFKVQLAEHGGCGGHGQDHDHQHGQGGCGGQGGGHGGCCGGGH